MKKILFICNEGMSTSVLAMKVTNYSKEKAIELNIDAKPESELMRCYKDYDLIMVAPQLAYMANKIAKRIEGEVPVGKLSAIDFGRMNIPGLYNCIVEELTK